MDIYLEFIYEIVGETVEGFLIRAEKRKVWIPASVCRVNQTFFRNEKKYLDFSISQKLAWQKHLI